jgi:hypothetical protein
MTVVVWPRRGVGKIAGRAPKVNAAGGAVRLCVGRRWLPTCSPAVRVGHPDCSGRSNLAPAQRGLRWWAGVSLTCGFFVEAAAGIGSAFPTWKDTGAGDLTSISAGRRRSRLPVSDHNPHRL